MASIWRPPTLTYDQALDSTTAGGGTPLYTPPPGPGGGGTSGPGWQPPTPYAGGSGGGQSVYQSWLNSIGRGSGGGGFPQASGGGNVPYPQAPGLPGGLSGYSPPQAPGAFQMPSAVNYGRAYAALDALGNPISIQGQAREGLGGPSNDNAWEAMALSAYRDGFDPGAGQFVGKEISDTVFTPEQVNQMAQQRAAPTIRALDDAGRLFGEQASLGGSFDATNAAALKARKMLEGAGAIASGTRDAQLEAAQANAAQSIAAAQNRRENFAQDLAARLGLGKLSQDSAEQLLSGGLQRRGLDQGRDIARFQGNVTQRGQDLDRSTAQATLNNQRDLARASGEAGLTGTQVQEELGRGNLSLGARGQDINFNLGAGAQGLEARGQDLNYLLGLGGLANQQYGTQAGMYNNSQDNATRIAEINAQLQNSALDRTQRTQLEQERMALQAQQFEAGQGQQERQFGANLGEQQREFDATQALQQYLAVLRGAPGPSASGTFEPMWSGGNNPFGSYYRSDPGQGGVTQQQLYDFSQMLGQYMQQMGNWNWN